MYSDELRVVLSLLGKASSGVRGRPPRWFLKGNRLVNDFFSMGDQASELKDRIGSRLVRIISSILQKPGLQRGVRYSGPTFWGLEGGGDINLCKLLPDRSNGAAYVAEPKRVMYCVHRSSMCRTDGPGIRVRGVAKGLQTSGKEVVVVSNSGLSMSSESAGYRSLPCRLAKEQDGISYVHLPSGTGECESFDLYLMQTADAFVREARTQRPSVIQASSDLRSALPALIAARRVGIPFVYEVCRSGEWVSTLMSSWHGNFEAADLMRQAESILISEADLIIASSEQSKEDLIAFGEKSTKIVVAPEGVDADFFIPLPRDEGFAGSHKISAEAPVIGFFDDGIDLGRADVLLKASSILARHRIEHQIVVVTDRCRRKLGKAVRERGLSSRVRVVSKLSDRELLRLLSTFDIVFSDGCLQERRTGEFPKAPLLAFSTMKATVLTNSLQNQYLAGADESRALLCTARDAETIAASLRQLIEDDEFRRRLGRSARLWTVTERSWNVIGQIMSEAHERARVGYAEAITKRRKLSELHVGVISDEVTWVGLEDSFGIEFIGRATWRKQLETTHFDFLIVESACDGKPGEWNRGIGYYSETESAELRCLLLFAREKGISTIFWNTDDPVRFERFAPNAALFDHVFTTDANMIPEYYKREGNLNRTISEIPFFAQSQVLNPLSKDWGGVPSIAFAESCIAGSYPKNAREIGKFLGVAVKYLADIYSSQADEPKTPKKLFGKYESLLHSALRYTDTIKSYRTHWVHILTDSVLNSPTMYSRRAVEIPASGGMVMSALGRGISGILGRNIANSNSADDYAAWLEASTSDQKKRITEIWGQMRTVYRAHTGETAFAIMARTTGMPVDGLQPLPYVASVPSGDDAIVASVLSQSIRPLVVLSERIDAKLQSLANSAGIPILTHLDDYPHDVDFQVFFHEAKPRTFAEDVLLAHRITDADTFFLRPAEQFTNDNSVVEPLGAHSPSDFRVIATRLTPAGRGQVVVTLPNVDSEALGEYPMPRGNQDSSLDDVFGAVNDKTILVAGHDLKFVQGLIQAMEGAGAKVIVDKWESHTKHDEAHSLAQLRRADIVFCEWGLGNAVWYSHRISRYQRLVIRVHRQEILVPYLARIAHKRVDAFIFVGRLIMEAAIASHRVPEEKSLVVPNAVDLKGLNRRKEGSAFKTIGLVGIVPQWKRLDLALDVLEAVLQVDTEYVLRIKGKTPEEYPWMKNRPSEMEFFNAQYARIERLNAENPGCVVFDGFDTEMDHWYSQVGVVLSTSDFESFHLTIADGAASGALPVCMNWRGAEYIYPLEWLVPTAEAAAWRILHAERDSSRFKKAVAKFDEEKVFMQLLRIIAGKEN